MVVGAFAIVDNRNNNYCYFVDNICNICDK